jgi:hypothetical protein
VELEGGVNDRASIFYAIDTEHRSKPAKRSMIHVKPNANVHLPLRNSSTDLNNALVVTLQSSANIDIKASAILIINP